MSVFARITSRWQTWPTSRRAIVWSLLAVSLVWIVLLGRMWWQPIVADDHLVYSSAVNWPNSPMRVNPPLYMYSVRLSFAIFGQSVGSARLPGVLAGYATLLLIPAVVTLALGASEQTNWTAVLAVWLYGVSPLALQNMMFIDIDTSFLTATLLALAWLWLKTEARSPWQRVAWLGAGFALTLWVKLLSPILTMGSIGLFYLLRGQWKRLLETVATSALGFAVFWITFQTNITSKYAFGYTGSYFSRLNIFIPENIRFMATVFPQGIGVVLLWLSLPVVIILGMAAAGSARRWWRRETTVVDGLLLYGVVCVAAYSLVTLPAWGYPRYQSPFIPILMLIAAMALAPALRRLPRSAWATLAGLAATYFAFNVWVIGDPLLRLYLVTYETTTNQVAPRLQQGLSDLARITIPLTAAILIGYRLISRLHLRKRDSLLVLIGVLAVANLASITVVQVEARYSTRYRYGYGFDDMLQAARRVQEYVAPTGFVAAIDDVLFYTERSGEGIYGLATRGLLDEPSISLLDLMHRHRIDALVWTTKDATRNPDIVHAPEMERILKECYNLETYGVFLVYLRKPDAVCP